MTFFHIIIGLMVLLFGRKLFWLFVAFSGFMVGFGFSEMLIPYYSLWIQMAIALGIGAIGALVAILAQGIAFVFAGCLAGFYIVLIATQSFGFNAVSAVWFLLGGAIGAVAAFVFIDWAIILLSAMIGAGIIVGTLQLSPTLGMISFMFLSIIGALIQIWLMDDMAADKKMS